MKHLWKLALCLALLAGVAAVGWAAPARAETTTTITYTLSCDVSYVFTLNGSDGSHYTIGSKLYENTSTFTAPMNDVTITVTASSGNINIGTFEYDNGNKIYNFTNKDYTLSFTSSAYYISNVKLKNLYTGYTMNVDNNTKSCTINWPFKTYAKIEQIEVTLSDTKPVRTYNITYELDGGENAEGNPATYSDDTAVTLLAPTRTNYDFGGWYDNSGLTGDSVTAIPVGASGDKNFWAKWTRKTYGYVDAAGTAQTPVEAEIITSSTALTTLYGGWYVVPADASCGTVRLMGNGTVNIILCDGATLSLEKIDKSYSASPSLVIWGQAQGTGTLDFQWLDQINSVTVNSGELTCSSANSSYAINNPGGPLIVNGGEVRLAAGNMGSVAGNVTFNGGKLESGKIKGNVTLNYTSADDRVMISHFGGSVTVASGKYYKDNSGRYYYGTLADWQKNAIKGKELQPAPDAHAVTVNSVTYGTLTADKAVAETGDTVTVTAAPQAGYAVGSVKYNGSNAARVDDTHYTFTMPDADVTVTGGMTPIHYEITYAGVEDAAFAAQNPVDYTIESPAITLNDPTRTGYTFAGWTGTGLSGATTTVTIPAGSTGNRAYTATWTANEYSVSFDGNGATGGGMSAQGFTYDAAQALSTCTLTRTGYHFTGWNTAANGGGTAYADGQEVLNLTAEDEAVVELYAQWEANTYTVHFDPNDPDGYNPDTGAPRRVLGTMTDQSGFAYDGAARELTKNTFHMTTGEWLGWNTAPDGSGTAYTDEQPVSNLTAENGGTVTLYAQWRVKYRFNYGSVFRCYLYLDPEENPGWTPSEFIWAYPGDTVKVDVTDSLNEYTITVTGADGTGITFDTDANTFTMPDQEVWIESDSVTKKMAYATDIYLNGSDDSDIVYLYDAAHPTVMPTVTVKDGETTLTEGTHYTLTITGNTGSSTQMVRATVTVKAMENSGYVGANTKTFRITPYNIANCEIKGKLEAYQGYQGIDNSLEDNVQVWYGDTQLTYGYDSGDYYIEYEYADPYVVGETYDGTIIGTGDWGGSKGFTFTFVELYHTVVFDANGGTGTIADDTIGNDGGYAGIYTLPGWSDFTPPYGKTFDHWEVYYEGITENPVKQPGDYFTAPFIMWGVDDVQTITVTAIWKDLPRHTVTVTGLDHGALLENGAALTLTDGKAQVYEGYTVSVVPENTDYELRGLTVTDANDQPVAVTNNSFTMPDCDVTVDAVIVRMYDVTVSITEGSAHGTVTADVSRAAQGDTVTLTVAPDAKYMPVLDEETSMPVTVTDGNGEKVTPTFATIWIDGVPTPVPNQYTFTMPASAVTVTAAFVPAEYSVYLSYLSEGEPYPFENGSLAVTADGQPVAGVGGQYPARPDQEIAVTVSPATGYALVEITGVYNNPYQNIIREPLALTQDTSNPNRWSFTMPDGDPKLEARMRKLPVVTFKVDDAEYATVPTDETGIVTPPDDPAKDGWQFAAWHQVVNGEMSETPFNFNTEITEGITLKATFNKLYTVTVSSGAGGTVTADPASAVAGKAIALDIQPSAGYILDTLTVTDGNGDPVSVANDAFTMPAGGATVAVWFEALPVATFLVDDTEVASVTADETGIVTPPADPAKDGYRFDGWYQVMDGQGTLVDTAFDFENTQIEADITLKAKWVQLFTIAFITGDSNATGTMDPVTIDVGATYTLPESTFTVPTNRIFREWSVKIGTAAVESKAVGDTITVTADTIVTAVWELKVFGTPTFTMPSGLKTIEESAFEGMTAMTIVDASNVTSIGKWAFKDSGITQIKLPKDCTINANAFSECGTVYVYAPAGGKTQTSCSQISNVVFVEE